MSTEEQIQRLSSYVADVICPQGNFPVYLACQDKRDFLCLRSEIETENVDLFESTIKTLGVQSSMELYDCWEHGIMASEMGYYRCSELAYRKARKKVAQKQGGQQAA